MRKLAILGASLLALSPQLGLAQDEPVADAAPVDLPPPPTAAMSAAAVGSARTAPERRLTGADLFDLAIASDPQISPDGRHIAYVRRANDIMTDRAVSSIWLIDTATGEESTPAAATATLCAALVARRQAPRLRLDRGRSRAIVGALAEWR